MKLQGHLFVADIKGYGSQSITGYCIHLFFHLFGTRNVTLDFKYM